MIRVFLNSKLTGNQLAKLAGISSIPDLNKEIIVHSDFNEVLNDIIDYLDDDEIDKSWQVILNWENDNG